MNLGTLDSTLMSVSKFNQVYTLISQGKTLSVTWSSTLTDATCVTNASVSSGTTFAKAISFPSATMPYCAFGLVNSSDTTVSMGSYMTSGTLFINETGTSQEVLDVIRGTVDISKATSIASTIELTKHAYVSSRLRDNVYLEFTDNEGKIRSHYMPGYYPSRSYTSGLQISTGTISSCQLYVPVMTASQLGVAKPYAVRSSAITATTGGTTSGRYYGVERDSNNQLFVNVPWESGGSSGDHYPTTFTWTNGTSAGPTGSLTGNTGFTAVSFPAIPAASYTQSGIITTGNQSLKGMKTFYSGGVEFTNANYTIPPISLQTTESNVLKMSFASSTNANLKMFAIGADSDGSYFSLINDMYTKKIELRGYISGQSTPTPWTSYLQLPQSKGTSANYDTLATTSDLTQVIDLR